MEPMTILKLAIVLSIILIVFSIGLGTPLGTGLRLFRTEPGLAFRAMVAMFILMPAFALLATWMLPLERPVRMALLALAVSPMPPILPRKDRKMGGTNEFIAGTLLLAPVVAMLIIPLFMLLAEHLHSTSLAYDPWATLNVLIITIGAPLAAGIFVGHFLPSMGKRLEPLVSKAGTILLGICGAILLFFTFPAMRDAVGNGTLVAIVAMIGFGLVVGHVLGGPLHGNRRSLAITTSSRHPGVAIGVAAAAYPEGTSAIVGAVLLYLLMNALLTIPYARWASRLG